MNAQPNTTAPHVSILKSFTAVETNQYENGQGITVYTLTRENIRDGFRMVATSFKTFNDGFHLPKLRREFWTIETATDMIERFRNSPNCNCTQLI